MPQKNFKISPGFILWLLLILGYVLYLPGQRGVFHFDDSANLHGLAQVNDSWTALVFLIGGEAGPLSRPVALASFLLNQGDWPNSPQGFLYINILIHLLNGALLSWFTLRLIRLIQPNRTQPAEWIAVSTAALWLLSPLLASTSLIIIQRMASLCATFVLAGLLTYLIGLSREACGQVIRGRWLQALGIGLGTLLAALTKENGVLLPLYALILEGTVLAGVVALSSGRRWRMLLLALPPLALLAYLATHLSPAAFAIRDFTLTERLLTQPIILWDYLRLALFPQATAFTPFHDDYPIAHSLFDPPTALLAILAWLIVFGLAIWRRRRWPWFAFAVLWYLGGHALESSTLPLELYFEHRNYLPLIGPALALSYFVWTPPASHSLRRLAPAALGGYLLLLAAILWQVTTLWGQPFIASQLWAREHPASIRTMNFLAESYLASGNIAKARQVLEQAAHAHPIEIGLALNAMVLTCRDETISQDAAASKIQALYRGVLNNAPTSKYSASASGALLLLQDLINQGKCQSFERAHLHKILALLMTNPSYTASGRQLNYLHNLWAGLYRDERNLNDALKHLQAAWAAESDIGTAVLIVSALISAGLRDEAQAFLKEAQQNPPANPVLRREWRKIINQLWEIASGNKTPASP